MDRKTFRRTVLAFLGALAILTGILYGMSLYSGTQPRASLILMTSDTSYEFWNFVRQGAHEGARELGVELDVSGPRNEEDVEGQIQLVREAIRQKADVILLAPVDQTRLQSVAQEVDDAGIPLILLDSRLEDDDPRGPASCFVGINNREAARSLAREMASSLDGQGKVAILTGVANSSTLSDRSAGLRDTLAEYPDMELVEEVVCGDSDEVAYEQARRILEQHPDLRGMFGTNPVVNEGVARALRERDPDLPHVFFYAFDTSVSQNAYLEEGIVDGFVAQLAFNLGYLAVEAGCQATRGLLRTSSMDSGYVYADQENMREESIQKLIYPFTSA